MFGVTTSDKLYVWKPAKFVRRLPHIGIAIDQVSQGLKQHAGIAGIFDVQIGRLNDIVEERLQLRVTKVPSGSVELLCAFFKEPADVVSCNRDKLKLGEPSPKLS